MNNNRYDVINLMRTHTSVRDYTDEAVSEEDRLAIAEAVRAASSSSFLQLVTTIRVTDPELRKAFARLSGNQKHVETAPEFWVFCADMHRNKTLCPGADAGWTEHLLTTVVDAGIAAQSAMTALESLGLGGCFIGGIRNGIEEADRLLGLPDNVVPLLGLAFGHPAIKNEIKPRLPLEAIFLENRYNDYPKEKLDEYDEVVRRYYKTRSRGSRDANWSGSLPPLLVKERRPFIRAYLDEKGLGTK